MKEISRDGRHRAQRLTSAPCSAARNVLFCGFLVSQTAPRVRFLVLAVLQKGKSRPSNFFWAIPQVRGGICWRYHPWNPAQEFGVASRCVSESCVSLCRFPGARSFQGSLLALALSLRKQLSLLVRGVKICLFGSSESMCKKEVILDYFCLVSCFKFYIFEKDLSLRYFLFRYFWPRPVCQDLSAFYKML